MVHLDRLAADIAIVRERARALGARGCDLTDRCGDLAADIARARASGDTKAVSRMVGFLVAEKYTLLESLADLQEEAGLPVDRPRLEMAALVVVMPGKMMALEAPPTQSTPVAPKPTPATAPAPVAAAPAKPTPRPTTTILPGERKERQPHATPARDKAMILPGELMKPVVLAASAPTKRCSECGGEFASNYVRQVRCGDCIDNATNGAEGGEKLPAASGKCGSCIHRRPCPYGCRAGKPCEHAYLGWQCGIDKHRDCAPLFHGHYYKNGTP